MSNSINPAKRVAADIKRKHPRISIFAASAAAAGVLGSAGFAVASAPWSQAAGDAVKTVQSGPQSASGHSGTAAFDAETGAKVQLDALRSAATDGATIDGAAAVVSHSATHQPAKPAVDNTAKHAPAKPEAKHAPAKHAPAKHALAKHAAARHAPAKHAPAKKHAPARPYHIWDSVTPSALPAGHTFAAYANGAYAASARQIGHHKSVLWIDTNGTNPSANVLDVEPGDATPARAAAWAQQRLARHPGSVAIIYTMLSSWQQVKSHVAHLPKAQQDNVRYWIADPTGTDHIVPGASATQWYWGTNIDISTASPSLTQLG
jgi:hypothetical protein